MFTNTTGVNHQIKVYLLFDDSKLPKVPKSVKKDFKDTDDIISFYKNDKIMVLVSLGKKDIEIEELKDKIKDVRKYLKNYPKKIPLFILDGHMLEDQIQLINQSYYKFDYKTTKKARKNKKGSNSLKKNKKAKFYILSNSKINPKEQKIMAESIELLKNLGDEPANILNPEEYVKRIKQVCHESNLKVRVFNTKDLKKMGMNSLLSVSRGSEYGGYLVEITHGDKSKNPIIMVGKGITFDTGGISLKGPNNMYEMKGDMIGSAIVLATMRNIGMMKLKTNVVGLLAIAENAIGSNATRPGDVVESYSGKTIEIRDTDAEGRLVMADALSYSKEMKPSLIIDIATLTGQQWKMSCGLFGSITGFKEDTVKEFIEVGKKTNNRLVEMPFIKEFVNHTKSKIADVKNAEFKCDKASIAHAGAFLSNFVDKNSNWIHLDVAGPTFIKERTQDYGVRLLTEYIKKNIY